MNQRQRRKQKTMDAKADALRTGHYEISIERPDHSLFFPTSRVVVTKDGTAHFSETGGQLRTAMFGAEMPEQAALM